MRIFVRDHERAVLRLDGRIDRVLGPGRHTLPRLWFGHTREVQLVDVRLRWTLVVNQEVPTADVPDVRVSAAAYWRVADPAAYVGVAQHPDEVLRLTLQLAVRDAAAARELPALAAERGEVSAELLAPLAAQGLELGIEVTRVELRDVSPPGEVRRAALAVHTARQHGLAALERARGETAALRALANGARVLTDHPALLQLRTAEAAAAAGGTVVLGLPTHGDRTGAL